LIFIPLKSIDILAQHNGQISPNSFWTRIKSPAMSGRLPKKKRPSRFHGRADILDQAMSMSIRPGAFAGRAGDRSIAGTVRANGQD
jgi:hypothetical protein